jgi:HEAT repeat protein
MGPLLGVLGGDPWTFVRAHVADTLGLLPAGDAVDQPLGDALEDRSPIVRVRVIEALARHRAIGLAPKLRDHFLDKHEMPEVRERAARALGWVCDKKSIDELTEAAHHAADPASSAAARNLGVAAVFALGRLHPADLDARLAPLLDAASPPTLRDAAKSAQGERDRCDH